MTIAETEQYLIRELKNRSSHGAALLYDTYAANLHQVLFSILRNRQQADELLEEAFLNIWDNFDAFLIQENRLSLWVMGQTKRLAKAATVMQSETLPEESFLPDNDTAFGIALA